MKASRGIHRLALMLRGCNSHAQPISQCECPLSTFPGPRQYDVLFFIIYPRTNQISTGGAARAAGTRGPCHRIAAAIHAFQHLSCVFSFLFSFCFSFFLIFFYFSAHTPAALESNVDVFFSLSSHPVLSPTVYPGLSLQGRSLSANVRLYAAG